MFKSVQNSSVSKTMYIQVLMYLINFYTFLILPYGNSKLNDGLAIQFCVSGNMCMFRYIFICF